MPGIFIPISRSCKPTTAVLFHRLGPYHKARLKASGPDVGVVGVQGCSLDETYGWEKQEPSEEFKVVTLFEKGDSDGHSRLEVICRVGEALAALQPSVVAVPGWAGKLALSALAWCTQGQVPAILMSESSVHDEMRVPWKERLKMRVVRLCSAALVGGKSHADYMARLGMPKERIFVGYDAVDNRYFGDKVAEIRNPKSEIRSKYGLPERYFLASARLIEKKNLPRLLQAYARYRGLCGERQAPSAERTEPWDLVLLGDGPLREPLCAWRSALGVQNSVLLPGFKQYPELPTYYGLASAFIHASTTEQWGLVVNEAMASGLPVLVSNRCGCAPDLVQEGVNGFTFDPYDTEELARLMLKLSTLNSSQLSTLGDASREIIADWGPERFASGLKQAVECALRVGPVKPTFLQRAILAGLLRL